MYEDNYKELASAVVGVACEEYCLALRRKEKYTNLLATTKNSAKFKNYQKQLKRQDLEIKDIEDFFENEIRLYMENPPEKDYLIRTLKKIAKDNNYKVVRFLKNNTSFKED